MCFGKRKSKEGIAIHVPKNRKEMAGQLVKIHEKCKSCSGKKMNEASTRLQLIDPFIVALQYDLSDSDSVEVEQSLKIKKDTMHVDYALYENGSPIVFVEAKRNDSPLVLPSGELAEKYKKQLIKYFDNCKTVRVIVLTNGSEYMFFTHDANAYADTSKDKAINLSSFLSFNLANDDYVDKIDDLFDLVESRFDLKRLIKDKVNDAVKANVSHKMDEYRATLKNSVPKAFVMKVREETHCSTMITDEELANIIADNI